ncbi:hypothetical protein F5883DRAFT_716257 [Diaporthe sp. PMI_573]|nr:hypothetical protein F5883DRAFT_716257 [Diaporthaceae sp. PMI_573]
MANKKPSGAEITEEERNDPNAAWEATITKGMKETESEMFLQWISIIMIGVAVAGATNLHGFWVGVQRPINGKSRFRMLVDW